MSSWDSPARRARYMASFMGLLVLSYWAMTRWDMAVPGILGVVVAAVSGYLRMRDDPAVTDLHKSRRKPCRSTSSIAPASTRRLRP